MSKPISLYRLQQTRLASDFSRIAAAASLAITGLTACETSQPTPSGSGPPAVVVEVSEARRESIRDIVDLVGQLEAEESVLIKAETEGTIESVEFREGSRVARGDLLFRLRDDEQSAELREAEAALTLARADYQRAEQLRTRQAISEAELDAARSRWQQEAAERDLAIVELKRTEIRAPFDGVVGARMVSPGDRVDRNVGLVDIESVDRLRLVFSIPEIGVGLAEEGAAVSIEVAPYPGRRFPGEVYFVAPSLDPRTRRLLLKAWVPNDEGVLKPGLFANIRVEIARHEDALTVPEAAVSYDTQGPHLWRIADDGTAQRVAVEIGIRREGRVEIDRVLEGQLVEGDQVVSAGTNKVFPGARVTAAEATPLVNAEPAG